MSDYTEPQTPFEAAVRLIAPYVLRGDDPKDIMRGYGGAYYGSWAAQIGGRLHHGNERKHYTNDKILVQRVNGNDCAELLPFMEVYHFIKRRVEQPALFA